jgi:hypothetical protein
MPDDKKNFALLIAKGLDKKDQGSDYTDSEQDLTKDMPEEEGGGEKEMMENSAIADFLAAISAKNVPQAKVALKDFIELCYHESEESNSEE